MNNNLVVTAEASSRIDTSGMNMGFGTLLGVYVRARAGKYSRFGPRPLNPKPCSCCPWHAIEGILLEIVPQYLLYLKDPK